MDSKIAALGCDSYAYIEHNFDVNADGELKKPHYHVYLEFENPREFRAIGEWLGCGENNVEKVKSTKGCIRYLVHADNPEKAQYKRESITAVNLDIDKYFKTNDEAERAMKVVQIIDEMKGDIDETGRPVFYTLSDLIRRVCDAGCYDVFRRSQYLYVQMWREGSPMIAQKSGGRKRGG